MTSDMMIDAGVLFYTGLANYTDFKIALATLDDGAYNLSDLYTSGPAKY